MNKILRATVTLAVIGAIGLVAGCTKKSTTTVFVSPSLGTMLIHLDHTVGGSALVLNGSSFVGTDGAGNPYSVDKLRYFISNIRLHRDDGVTYGLDGYHYRDAGLPGTRDYMLAGVPEGSYTALSFTFGLDEVHNVSGPPISNDPNTAGMEWPPNWGGGWHYMILEGFHDQGGPVGYRTHLGRRYIALPGDPSGQGPDDVQYHHFFTVYLPFAAPVTISGNDWEVTASLEIDGWYEDPVFDLLAFFPTGTEGIMVNLTAQELLQENGPGCFTLAQQPTPR